MNKTLKTKDIRLTLALLAADMPCHISADSIAAGEKTGKTYPIYGVIKYPRGCGVSFADHNNEYKHRDRRIILHACPRKDCTQTTVGSLRIHMADTGGGWQVGLVTPNLTLVREKIEAANKGGVVELPAGWEIEATHGLPFPLRQISIVRGAVYFRTIYEEDL